MTEPQAPSSEKRDQQRLIQAFAHLDRHALGVSCGIVASTVLFLMTVAMTIKGPVACMACLSTNTRAKAMSRDVDLVFHKGPHLELLSYFLPGYSVGWGGAFIGLGWGLLVGYLIGHVFAGFLNLHHRIYLRVIERRLRSEALSNG